MTSPVAIVTGASQGIGAALVAGYRRAGYAVVGVARSLRVSGDESDYVAMEAISLKPTLRDVRSTRRSIGSGGSTR
jgi:NAD(P)-dependent dehydrogenase (short-subunit alcohol dehydrogenase family)